MGLGESGERLGINWSLEEALDYYKHQGAPKDQSALIQLLKEIRQENGSIPQYMLQAAAQAYEIQTSLLLALIHRIPGLRLDDTHTLQLCVGPNCGKHTALAACAKKLCAASAGQVKLQFMPCMRMCGKGPNTKFDGKLYHNATEVLLQQLITQK